MFSKKRYILLAVAAFALIIFLSGPRVIAPTVSSYAINLAAKSGIGLTIDDLRLGLSGNAKRLRVWTRKVPVTEILELSIEPRFLKLLQGNLSFHASGLLLEGQVSANIERHWNGSLSGSGTLSQINISKHALFTILPVNGGVFNVRLDSMSLDQLKLTAFGSFELSGLELTEALTLPSKFTGLPIPVDLPRFKINSLSAVIDIQNSKAQLSSIQLNSDLVKFKGHISGVLPKFNMIEATGCMTLSDQGVEKFGSFMPFIGGTSSSEPQTLKLSGSSVNRIKATVTTGCGPEML